MKNAFSVDVEDWFCVYNFSKVISYDQWDACELRVVTNTRRILSILNKYNIKATFFILGWVADRCPELTKEIASEGHEIATHGYAHLLVKQLTPQCFEQDLVRSLEAIKKGTDISVKGFRAPSFSVTPEKSWIFQILAKHGIRYDSSLFPVVFHPDYANADVSLHIHKITDDIIEFPMSCFNKASLNLPCSGGGYFRLFPYAYTKYALTSCNKQQRPVVFYVHPWELDPSQPRVNNVSRLKRFRHYFNLEHTEKKLEKLFTDFQFDTIEAVLKQQGWIE